MARPRIVFVNQNDKTVFSSYDIKYYMKVLAACTHFSHTGIEYEIVSKEFYTDDEQILVSMKEISSTIRERRIVIPSPQQVAAGSHVLVIVHDDSNVLTIPMPAKVDVSITKEISVDASIFDVEKDAVPGIAEQLAILVKMLLL